MGSLIKPKRARESQLDKQLVQQQTQQIGDAQKKQAQQRRQIAETRVRALRAGAQRNLFELTDVIGTPGTTRTLG